MRFIAHRGNLEGPNPDRENHPDYIQAALDKGFDVELDAWIVDGKIYLGHDKPDYEATDYFQYQGKWYQYNGNYVDSPALWVHCKNFQALSEGNTFYFHGHYFTHDNDDFTLTSTGWIWTYPRNLPLGSRSVAVMPERVPDWDLSRAGGICTDYPIKYQAFR